MDTFVARSPTYHYNNHHNHHHHHHQTTTPSTPTTKSTRTKPISIPNCATTRCNYLLPPPIEFNNKQARLGPLTIEEFESKFGQAIRDDNHTCRLELIERVFFGSISNNQLRAALWPYLFGLVNNRGKFEPTLQINGNKTKHNNDITNGVNKQQQECYIYIEHENNITRWLELSKLYQLYSNQWESILPDQEQRFSAFRERKSLIERDVIRCDRLHPFYAEEQNLETLTKLLMTYMMYDFDIGYVQGMSDIAAPILFLYRGDLVKSFWIFVEVMKLFRRNFELTQKTIHFQLNCLFELIKHTDPVFAQYLDGHESSNCFFAFRAIVCQFKRELMKEDEDDYSKVLFLWDTIWCAERRSILLKESNNRMSTTINGNNKHQSNYYSNNNNSSTTNGITTQHNNFRNNNSVDKYSKSINNNSHNEQQLIGNNIYNTSNDSPFYSPSFDHNQSDSPRHTLTDTEIFVLSLCLSMIRRERDKILANRLDGTDIHLHFINPKLGSDLNGFIENAINIYSYIKYDFDIRKLTSLTKANIPPSTLPESTPGSDGYDWLSDFLIINGVSDP